jgi:hypothetical protein
MSRKGTTLPETAVYNPVGQCWGKRAYASKRLAKRAAVQTMSGPDTFGGRSSPRKAYAYRCPHCRAWHVGHHPPKILEEAA